jgi:hypothetical protein
MIEGKHSDQKANANQGYGFPPLYVDQPPKYGTHNDGQQAMNTHYPPDLSFGSVELLEEEREDEKQGDAHKEKKISTQSYDERPIPHRFDIHHLSFSLCLIIFNRLSNALNRPRIADRKCHGERSVAISICYQEITAHLWVPVMTLECSQCLFYRQFRE